MYFIFIYNVKYYNVFYVKLINNNILFEMNIFNHFRLEIIII